MAVTFFLKEKHPSAPKKQNNNNSTPKTFLSRLLYLRFYILQIGRTEHSSKTVEGATSFWPGFVLDGREILREPFLSWAAQDKGPSPRGHSSDLPLGGKRPGSPQPHAFSFIQEQEKLGKKNGAREKVWALGPLVTRPWALLSLLRER